ncbi:MAG: hypothetical protein FOGNACKC_00864 [Anaerolineae bacterium]|nr:hypothetical protein [Anaerolineae bacterium]
MRDMNNFLVLTPKGAVDYIVERVTELDETESVATALRLVNGGDCECKTLDGQEFIIWTGPMDRRYEVYYRKKDDKWGEVDPDLCVEDLPDTHAYITTVAKSELGLVFVWMQGENWSPNGEARPIIERAGVAHTSMMTGDVVKDPDGVYWQCGYALQWHKLAYRDVQLRRVIIDRGEVRNEMLTETQLRQENEDAPHFAEAVLEAVMAGRAYNDTDYDGRWPLVFYVPGEV